jgi:hypothetical protein
MPYPAATREWHPSTPLERGLYRVVRWASIGCTVTSVGFIGYLCIGIPLNVTGVYTPSFPVVGLSDPVFTSLSLLIGGFVCLLSGSLMMLTALASVKDANAEYVFMMSLIAFGFGAATVRVTAGPALTWLSRLGPM